MFSVLIDLTENIVLPDSIICTFSEKISIVSDVLFPGYFEGVVYEDFNNPLNELQYVDIAYGGSGPGANLWLSGATQIKVVNSSFNYSANYGIYVSRYHNTLLRSSDTKYFYPSLWRRMCSGFPNRCVGR
ncbi:MAG: hypothetical protein K9H84_04580 [Bacteroidales bacterium]|nr:hypothetical protein [Bacteroidales bacterium]